jgi:hypothetical protein
MKKLFSAKISPGVLRAFVAVGSAVLCVASCAAQGISTPFNQRVLEAISRIPEGGNYAVSRAASDALSQAIEIRDGDLKVNPRRAVPSYCSGATYLVFLMALEPELRVLSRQEIGNATLQSLRVSGQPDGVGVWGRWNANGPGTAKLFHDTGMGRSFWDFEATPLPGDFLKLWWKEAIGRDEFGHSVIFREYTISPEGEKGILVWSSNKPDGYGNKFVPFHRIRHALFSRCEDPQKISHILQLENRDSFLAGMLRRNYPLAEVKALLRSPVPN